MRKEGIKYTGTLANIEIKNDKLIIQDFMYVLCPSLALFFFGNIYLSRHYLNDVI